MSAKLNLASQPFRNRALPWAITAIITAVSLVALVFIINRTVEANQRAASVERELTTLRTQAETLKKQAAEIKENLTPEQRQTLQSAHELVDRKRFSWSRLFSDLEDAMPKDVRVTRIKVRDVAVRGPQTIAELDLTVMGKETEDVTRMIAEMDRQGIFHAEVVSQTLQKGRSAGGTEWLLNVRYMPRAGAPVRGKSETSDGATAQNRGQQQ